MRFAVVADPVFLRHPTPPGHPERAQRLGTLLDALDQIHDQRVLRLEAVPAELRWIEKVHSQNHLEDLRKSTSRPSTQFDADTWAGPESFATALHAAGSCVRMVEQIVAGEMDAGFALVRPPGHHAERSGAMGFCLINNIAVCAQRARALPGIRRVAVVDYDVHHGNGTQNIFLDRSDILYISVHQHPLYPGSGMFGETGVAEGKGYTVNFPAPPGMGNHFYAGLMDELIVPILTRYQPDLLLASAGFDAHRNDPLASMELDTEGYRYIASRLNAAASQLCGGRILYVLEGGYNLAALAASVTATIETCIEGDFPDRITDDSDLGREWRQLAREAHRLWDL